MCLSCKWATYWKMWDWKRYRKLRHSYIWFLRVRVHDFMIIGGSLGRVGWKTKPLFLRILEVIKKKIRCSNRSPILQLMDSDKGGRILENRLSSFLDLLNLSNSTFRWVCSLAFQAKVICGSKWLVCESSWENYNTRGIYPFSKNTISDDEFECTSDDEFECTEVINFPSPQAPSICAESISENTQHWLVISVEPEDDHKTDCEDFNK